MEDFRLAKSTDWKCFCSIAHRMCGTNLVMIENDMNLIIK